MIRMMTMAAVGALAIGLGACGLDAPGPANESVNVPDEPGVANLPAAAATNVVASTTAPTSDSDFVNIAAASDTFEVQSSQKALTTTKTPAVKAYAQMMVDEHGKSSSELMTLASRMIPPMTLPTTLPAEQQALLDSLDGKTGKDFDRAYLSAQRQGHQGTLTKVNGYIAVAQPGDMKNFASRLTGLVQRHLSMVNKIKV